MLFKENYKSTKAQVYYVKNGIDDKLIDGAASQEKKYDACFLGGLRCSKGIDEFVPIWKTVVSEFPKAKFIVIGGGSAGIVKKLEDDISENGLQENILLLGPLSGIELYEKLKSCRVFLFPSHEEGWGIAVCEAMYCGLPVICYDLPAFKTFGSVLDTSEIGKHEHLAKKVIDYLHQPQDIIDKKESLVNMAKKYTWKSIATEEQKLFRNLLSPSS